MPPTLPLHNPLSRIPSKLQRRQTKQLNPFPPLLKHLHKKKRNNPLSPRLPRNPHRQIGQRPKTVHVTTQTEPPTRNYEEEIATQMAIAEKAKVRHKEVMTELNKLQEKAAKREAEIQRLLEERMAKIQATEKEVADLQAENTGAATRLPKEEETREQNVQQHFEETEALRG